MNVVMLTKFSLVIVFFVHENLKLLSHDLPKTILDYP